MRISHSPENVQGWHVDELNSAQLMLVQALARREGVDIELPV